MVDSPTADNPREPDITHTDPAAEKSWFGHPRQLARLFSTEAWERFGYYGMRALLMLYLTKHFIFDDRSAAGLYGGYTALVYLTPLIGGYLADQYLGSKRSVKFGAILMAIGYFTLCFGGQTAQPYAEIDGQRYAVQVTNFSDGPSSHADEAHNIVIDGQTLAIRGNDDGSVALLAADGSVARTVAAESFASGADRSALHVAILLLALSMVSIGNGFFKPNISTMVGELYEKGDRRRDSGFTIFYMGINCGSIGGQLVCPIFADLFGWWAGFLVVGLGMLISWTLIQFDGGRLAGYGEPPARTGPDRALLIYALAVLAVPVFYFLFVNLMNTPDPEPGSGIVGYIATLPLMGKLLFGSFLIGVPAILIWSWAKGSRIEFQMMVVAMVLITFNVVFWTLFEQAGSSLTLFADRNTELSVFGLFTLSAPQTQNFNPLSIVIFAPIMTLLWAWLARRNLEPSIPVKFAIALMGVGAGFLFLVWGTTFAGPDFKVGLWWLAGLYLIHSLAELCISPVGLSMITKLSIARIVGLMMGVWFLSISVAQYVAGVVAQVASVATVGGQVTNLAISLDTYTAVFFRIGWISMAIGLVLLAFSPLIKKWMHGVV
ncbi:peptide MFS transporter [Hephaestia sp. GCM10023244]|uniref:peptide MFS transporter n=1 Tax=unclassified Hephaestia TaxID=2631281 RepID=UPI0020772D87|nr:peptide MFS transporter [Hephaestia sp. MAHUQ-44]MCM8729756.1 peptide MFS transporter [Hephaestia sp. MAHUQ-44]